MSDRKAFEKWWTEQYSAHRLNQIQSIGGDLTGIYVDPRAERSWQAWQAAQAQVVNQQLLEALQKAERHLHAMMAHIDHKPRRFQEHCWQQVLDIRAAIAAAQEQVSRPEKGE